MLTLEGQRFTSSAGESPTLSGDQQGHSLIFSVANANLPATGETTAPWDRRHQSEIDSVAATRNIVNVKSCLLLLPAGTSELQRNTMKGDCGVRYVRR